MLKAEEAFNLECSITKRETLGIMPVLSGTRWFVGRISTWKKGSLS